jgi:3-mercaptopyruvate sulfurtransferase SseA
MNKNPGAGSPENAGFKTVYNLTGGTQAWTKAGFETEVSASARAGSRQIWRNFKRRFL